ncbi:YbhB/YbcL family Raf kinase inhibitor-like protein [Endozoicomonas ascidiicola]|uniref:YbhB/YbcL family Raf kinase inhibitor-like protein n=1 Tax=Endozoicomonas ascidiicola TaxID=1698521 RepID=UPI00082ABB83|nr:YbhB/YbcL family Raf kinase inhibitor-like protein [Endozoicomonas ascidiicola]
MKYTISLLVAGLLSISLSTWGAEKQTVTMNLKSPQVTNGQSFHNQQIFNHWGCTGKNVSPELQWDKVPDGTKSFAVTMYDPNAPTGSGWWHWVVINIAGDVHSLTENAGKEGGKQLPKGARMLRNDFGFEGYGGACPPPDATPHQYHITVYALDIANLDVDSNASPAMAGYYILQHMLAKAVLTAPTNKR